MIIVSRIIHVKVDRRLNVTNKFKYQRRLSSRLAIVMFRGTPCITCILNLFLSKQLTINKCTLLDCTNTMYFIYLQGYSTHLRFGKLYTNSFGTDTHT